MNKKLVNINDKFDKLESSIYKNIFYSFAIGLSIIYLLK